jgi:tetratricopeptide (TPR) repeat protein
MIAALGAAAQTKLREEEIGMREVDVRQREATMDEASAAAQAQVLAAEQRALKLKMEVKAAREDKWEAVKKVSEQRKAATKELSEIANQKESERRAAEKRAANAEKRRLEAERKALERAERERAEREARQAAEQRLERERRERQTAQDASRALESKVERERAEARRAVRIARLANTAADRRRNKEAEEILARLRRRDICAIGIAVVVVVLCYAWYSLLPSPPPASPSPPPASPQSPSSDKLFARGTKLSTVSVVQHVLELAPTEQHVVAQVAALHDAYANAHGGEHALDAEERAWRRQHRRELKRLTDRPHALQPHAQWLWGKLVYSGRVPNMAKWETAALAEKSWRAAAASGHALAMNALGGLLQHKGDIPAAIGWWKQAVALAAIPEALYNLGVSYGRGEGGTQLDLDAAAAFYNHAAGIEPPASAGETGAAARKLQRGLWQLGHFAEPFANFKEHARANLHSVDYLQRRVLDPNGLEADLRAQLDDTILPSGVLGSLRRETRDASIAGHMRDLDALLGTQTTWWVEDSEDPENYCRLVDACLVAVEDAYTSFDHDIVGPYAEAVVGMENGALGYLEAFLEAAESLQLLPPWWQLRHSRQLLRVAQDELGDCYIRHAIEWRDAVDIWGDATARALRALGKRVDEAIEGRDRWVHDPLTAEKTTELMSQPDTAKFQRLLKRHGTAEKVLEHHPEMMSFVRRLEAMQPKQTPGIQRRQRRIPSAEEHSDTMPPSHDADSYAMSESAALREQRRLLKANQGVDYMVVDYPTTASDAGIVFTNAMGKIAFKYSMELAASGSTHAVTQMYTQLSSTVTQQLGVKALPAIRKQLQQEFGVDPLGDTTDEEAESLEAFDRLMQSLSMKL